VMPPKTSNRRASMAENLDALLAGIVVVAISYLNALSICTGLHIPQTGPHPAPCPVSEVDKIELRLLDSRQTGQHSPHWSGYPGNPVRANSDLASGVLRLVQRFPGRLIRE
jgi:hypothetical protein